MFKPARTALSSIGKKYQQLDEKSFNHDLLSAACFLENGEQKNTTNSSNFEFKKEK